MKKKKNVNKSLSDKEIDAVLLSIFKSNMAGHQPEWMKKMFYGLVKFSERLTKPTCVIYCSEMEGFNALCMRNDINDAIKKTGSCFRFHRIESSDRELHRKDSAYTILLSDTEDPSNARRVVMDEYREIQLNKFCKSFTL